VVPSSSTKCRLQASDAGIQRRRRTHRPAWAEDHERRRISSRAELEEQARRRTEEISAGEAAAERAAVMDEDRSPDAEIAELERSGRQHDYTDTAAYNQQQSAAVDRRRRGGPRR
jgi:hypothetical protein